MGDYTLAEIKQLRILDGDRGDAGQVPSLEEALDFMDGRILVLLGLKSYEVESLAPLLRQHATGNLMLFELYYPGTDQSKLRALADAAGVGVSITPYGSHDDLAALNEIHGQLGPALKSFWVKQKGLSPALMARLKDLGVFALYSGWSGPEDYALVEDSDDGPWRAVLSQGLSVVTDQPELVLEILGR